MERAQPGAHNSRSTQCKWCFGVLCLSDKELFTELKNFLKAQLQRFPSVSGQKDG